MIFQPTDWWNLQINRKQISPKNIIVKVIKLFGFTNDLTRNKLKINLYTVEEKSKTAKSLYILLKNLGLSGTITISFLKPQEAAVVKLF